MPESFAARTAGLAAFASAILVALAFATAANAQLPPLDRLPGALLDVEPPDQRVSGQPGQMRIVDASCDARGLAATRERIVDIAVQEWAFFGFHIVDQTGPPPPRRSGPFRRRPWMEPIESERVSSAIAGYWSITPDGNWILERQNAFWRGPLGVGERWRDPWSAAFISWTMCEAGMTESSAFRRSINHHTYIDQAIRARDGAVRNTSYVAWNVGEQQIEPGDLLCSARRHGYRNLQDRRRHLGDGARTHCDIVVHIDPQRERILAIGGNVRGRVSLKLLYAQTQADDPTLHAAVGRGDRTIFAHLRLSNAAGDAEGLLESPSIQTLLHDEARRRALEAALQMTLPPPAQPDERS